MRGPASPIEGQTKAPFSLSLRPSTREEEKSRSLASRRFNLGKNPLLSSLFRPFLFLSARYLSVEYLVNTGAQNLGGRTIGRATTGLVDGSQRRETGPPPAMGEVSRAHRQRFAWILSGNEVGRWTRGDRQREYTMPQERRNALILIVAPRTRPPVTVAVVESGEPRQRRPISRPLTKSPRVFRENAISYVFLLSFLPFRFDRFDVNLFPLIGQLLGFRLV